MGLRLSPAIAFFAFAVESANGQIYAPPDSGLTDVAVDFDLLTLDVVNEKSEAFEADLYLEYEWDDPPPRQYDRCDPAAAGLPGGGRRGRLSLSAVVNGRGISPQFRTKASAGTRPRAGRGRHDRSPRGDRG